MIKLVDDSLSIDYFLCTVLVSCTVMYFVVKITYICFWRKIYVAHNVIQLLFRTRFSYL